MEIVIIVYTILAGTEPADVLVSKDNAAWQLAEGSSITLLKTLLPGSG